jgi:hypothetical protein
MQSAFADLLIKLLPLAFVLHPPENQHGNKEKTSIKKSVQKSINKTIGRTSNAQAGS